MGGEKPKRICGVKTGSEMIEKTNLPTPLATISEDFEISIHFRLRIVLDVEAIEYAGRYVRLSLLRKQD